MQLRHALVPFVLAAVTAAQQPATARGAAAAAPAASATAPSATPATSGGEAAFDAGLAAVHAAMQKAKWPEARTALLALLQAHPNAVYAQAQADAIASDLRTCAFFAQLAPVTLGDVVTGKVASYDATTGRIKIAYRGDFADWEVQDELLLSPFVFAGPYTVTASGKAYPVARGDFPPIELPGGRKPVQNAQSLRVAFDLDPSGAGGFVADFGFATISTGLHQHWLPASVAELQAEAEPKPLQDAPSRAVGGQPFTAVLRVTEDKVELQFDKAPVLKAKRRKAELGQVAVWRGTCDDVLLEGKIEPASVQGRIDEAIAKKREAFDKTFDPKKELPAWLFERPKLQRAMARSLSSVPEGDRGASDAFHETLELLAAGKLADAEKRLAGLGDDDAPALARTFVAAVLQMRHGRPEAVEAACTKMSADHPGHSQVELLRARALDDLGRGPEALAVLDAVCKSDPGFMPAWEQRCVQLLRAGRADEARRAVREAKVVHGLWQDVAELEQTLAMATRGPAWARRFSYQSPHYDVISDIDRKVCIEACRVLEESYVNLMSQLTWIKEDKDQPRFRVFLFAGEAGYQEYVKAIIGEAVPHSAGLYTPVLKQLLIWNVPRREDMVRTIRHEGFHQFLDRVMDNPPTWLNEGMAEFWETAQREQGRMQGGQVRKDHLATLVRSRAALPKLEQFVHGGHADFYANAQLRYAQAWSLVHFLRKGPPAYTARFTKLWAELRTAKSTRAAIETAFAGADWAKLEQDWQAHLTSLR